MVHHQPEHPSNGDSDASRSAQTTAGAAQDVEHLIGVLAGAYPDARWQLDFATPLQLAVATILSARSTDKKINELTPALFARYHSAEDYASAELDELETLIHASGFFRAKAAALRSFGAALVERHGGELPHTLDELVALPGIGRKTANVILGNAFNVPGIVVDTHFSRLVQRWKWTNESDPKRIELAVAAVVSDTQWVTLSNRTILHGRQVCHARKPACGACILNSVCPSFGAGPTNYDDAANLVRGDEALALLESIRRATAS